MSKLTKEEIFDLIQRDPIFLLLPYSERSLYRRFPRKQKNRKLGCFCGFHSPIFKLVQRTHIGGTVTTTMLLMGGYRFHIVLAHRSSASICSGWRNRCECPDFVVEDIVFIEVFQGKKDADEKHNALVHEYEKALSRKIRMDLGLKPLQVEQQ